MRLSFEDRTYLVTGGGSGIGKGVAAGLAAAGASVMIIGRNPDRLSAAVKEIEAVKADGGEVRYEPADITNEEEATHAVEAATAWHGRLHGAVHCAGGSLTIGPITQMDSDAVATHRRSEHQRHHVRPQALRPRDGARGRRVVRRHLVDRLQQHPPVVRRLRRHQGGASTT